MSDKWTWRRERIDGARIEPERRIIVLDGKISLAHAQMQEASVTQDEGR